MSQHPRSSANIHHKWTLTDTHWTKQHSCVDFRKQFLSPVGRFSFQNFYLCCFVALLSVIFAHSRHFFVMRRVAFVHNITNNNTVWCNFCINIKSSIVWSNCYYRMLYWAQRIWCVHCQTMHHTVITRNKINATTKIDKFNFLFILFLFSAPAEFFSTICLGCIFFSTFWSVYAWIFRSHSYFYLFFFFFFLSRCCYRYWIEEQT